jgi:DNA (cytosine-5)-methyltransferase 1
MGFVMAGYRPIFAVENDADAAATYEANFGGHCHREDIQEREEFPKADVVIGGPPCQGFSNLGKNLPYDPRNQLWRYFMKAVERTSPSAFVIENVPPLLKSEEYAEIVREAEALGYSIEGQVLNAADFGVPQTRRRAIVIAVKGSRPRFPTRTHLDPSLATLPLDGLRPWRTVRDAIGDLPRVPDGANWHVGRNPTLKSLERYRYVPEGGNRWDLYRSRPDLTPNCWIRKVSGGTDLFGRLWWDRPAFTIRTEFFKPEKGRYLHPEANRPLTHREAARLQTFPDTFEFVGSKTSVARQIGNAVPPLLAKAIGLALLPYVDGGAGRRRGVSAAQSAGSD